jgi:sortase A
LLPQRGKKKQILYIAQIVTLIVGGLLLAWPTFLYLKSTFVQRSGSRQIDRAYEVSKKRAPENPVPGEIRTRVARPVKKGSVLAKFEVPRLKMSLVVLEGTDAGTLDKSIGHVESTAEPGEYGNIGIAGHRNTHFRKMEWIRRGDEIILKSSEDRYRYLVDSIRLVTPDDVEVLDDSLGPAVTIVTCFPFEYVGHAPNRFIVRAIPDEETRQKLAHVVSSR